MSAVATLWKPGEDAIEDHEPNEACEHPAKLLLPPGMPLMMLLGDH